LKVSSTGTGTNVLASPRQSPQSLGIGVLPNTSYTYSFRMKTNYVSGDSNDGAYIGFKERNQSGTNTTTTQTMKVKTTTDWTYYTGSFTTSSTTVVIDPQPTVAASTGAATLIMDAWFDDIVLKPTSA